MTLMYMLFAKGVPIISMWELKTAEHEPGPGHAPEARASLGEVRP